MISKRPWLFLIAILISSSFIYSFLQSQRIVKAIQQLQQTSPNSFSIADHVGGDALADVTAKKTNEIKSWGCHNTDAPFIFVHIDKAGGGSVRARLSLGATNVTKKQWKETDGSFYPVDEDNQAVFKSSNHNNNLAFPGYATFEGSQQCQAVTPLGIAACFEASTNYAKNHPTCLKKDEKCLEVYAGHNSLGNEMHWLPDQQLDSWWNITAGSHIRNQANMSSLSQIMESILKENNLPNDRHSKNLSAGKYKRNFATNIQLLTSELDELATQIVTPQDYENNGWSTLYETLPVLRATMIREPFSWLLSNFLWHSNQLEGKNCSDDKDILWAHRFALKQIHFLCGEDCKLAFTLKLTTIDRMEKQAAANLRRSISVVGLLNETDTFYEMINKRVKYINIPMDLKKGLNGNRSRDSAEKLRCKSYYSDPSFQEKLISNSPAIAALVRLYQVGLEVNRFQMQELESCPSLET